MKETRTKIPEGTTRVINAATGEVKHPKFCRCSFQSNELLYKAKAEYYELYALTLEKELDEFKAKLHGTRQHVLEVTMREDDDNG